jgi:hypothetical protein
MPREGESRLVKSVDKNRLATVTSRVMPVTAAPTLLHTMVWGRVKSGKTRFAASGPKPVLFLAERGHMTVRNVPDLQIFPLNPDGSFRKVIFKDMYDFLYYLRYSDHDRKTVAVDTMSALTRIAMKYILKDEESRDDAREPGVADKRTWGRLSTAMIEVMEELEVICKTKGLHLVYTAQERRLREEDVEEEGSDVVPDFSPSVRSFIVEKPDILARTFIDDEEDDSVSDDEGSNKPLRYGMMFRDAAYYVGERVTPPGADEPWLPRYGYNMTIPKLIRMIEGKKNASSEAKPLVRRKPGAGHSKGN